jgi:hypothetical protein
MNVAGCYVLQLHCPMQTHKIGVPRDGQFTAQTRGGAMRSARSAGWIFIDDKATGETNGIPMCPHCRKSKLATGVDSGAKP